jgi:hypothetical protein
MDGQCLCCDAQWLSPPLLTAYRGIREMDGERWSALMGAHVTAAQAQVDRSTLGITKAVHVVFGDHWASCSGL